MDYSDTVVINRTSGFIIKQIVTLPASSVVNRAKTARYASSETLYTTI